MGLTITLTGTTYHYHDGTEVVNTVSGCPHNVTIHDTAGGEMNNSHAYYQGVGHVLEREEWSRRRSWCVLLCDYEIL